MWEQSPKTDLHLYEMMRHSKRQYHYAVRRLKRQQAEKRAMKFSEAMAENRSRDFFAEVKKQNPRPPAACSINGLEGEYNIADFFQEKCNTLYNSVQSNPERLEAVRSRIRGEAELSAAEECHISPAAVEEAVRKLKHGKRDGDKGLVSSHLLYSSRLFMSQIAAMLTAAFIHGWQPSPLLNATIVSIPKSLSKSITDGENYRGIALSSSLAKVFYLIFLQRNSECLQTSDLQFASKRDQVQPCARWHSRKLLNPSSIGGPMYSHVY